MRSLGRTLQRATWMATALVLADFAVGRARRTGPFPLDMELSGLAGVAGLGLGLALFLCLGASLARLRPRAGTWAVLATLAATYADLVFVHWESALHSPRVVVGSLPIGLAVGLAVYLVAQRTLTEDAQAASSPARVSTLGWLPLLPLALVALAPLLVPAPTDGTGPEPATRQGHALPRVLMIVVDTLRADALARTPTPTLDALAGESQEFTAARAPSGWTLPSMVSLLTGVSPLVHGATERISRLPDVVPTLAEHMEAAGYRTGAIGQNAVLNKSRRLNRGFHTYHFKAPAGPPTRSLGTLIVGLSRPSREPVTLDAEDINALAFDWLEQHAHEDFFLWLHYYDPHLVYEPPTELLPSSAPPRGMGGAYSHESFKEQRGGYEVLDRAQRAWVRLLYDLEVTYLDGELGKLFERMRELGIYDDTLIVFTSDHGEEFWEHEGFEHGHTLYEEVMRVPLLVRVPGRSGGEVETLVSLENVAPSILTLCGIEYDAERLSGTSLFEPDGSVAAAPRVPRMGVGNLYYQDRYSVLFGQDRYKYIWIAESGIEELYDLEADPEERSSLVATAPDLLERGRARFEEAKRAAEQLRERLGAESSSAELTAEDWRTLQGLGYAGDSPEEE